MKRITGSYFAKGGVFMGLCIIGLAAVLFWTTPSKPAVNNSHSSSPKSVPKTKLSNPELTSRNASINPANSVSNTPGQGGSYNVQGSVMSGSNSYAGSGAGPPQPPVSSNPPAAVPAITPLTIDPVLYPIDPICKPMFENDMIACPYCGSSGIRYPCRVCGGIKYAEIICPELNNL